MPARIGPFFKYYGSKYRIAPKYPEPLHDCIVEPFAGSASYATLHAARQVILCETDAEVAALWSWLIATPGEEIAALPAGLPMGLDIRTLDVPAGAKLLIRQWQRVGHAKCWTVSKWGHLSGFWCERTRDRIAAQVESIRHWRVLAGSPLNFDGASPPATWFIDPPYQMQPTVYGNAALDYAALGAWVRRLPGQAIVCEAPGADWLPFRQFTLARSGPGGAGNSHQIFRQELIWTSE